LKGLACCWISEKVSKKSVKCSKDVKSTSVGSSRGGNITQSHRELFDSMRFVSGITDGASSVNCDSDAIRCNWLIGFQKWKVCQLMNHDHLSRRLRRCLTLSSSYTDFVLVDLFVDVKVPLGIQAAVVTPDPFSVSSN
jgi:hypothetical protein